MNWSHQNCHSELVLGEAKDLRGISPSITDRLNYEILHFVQDDKLGAFRELHRRSS